MRNMKTTVGLMMMGAFLTFGSPALAQQINEGFDNITGLPGAGWALINRSSPIGTTNWVQGNDTVFTAHSGATTSYIAANFNNTTGAGNISNWLITPVVTLANGASVTFWTRTTSTPTFADRLQVRASIAGASTNVGATDATVGDFTYLLLDINPTLIGSGYPNVWTEFTITVSGLPAGTQSGRYAFRYFVTNGGPSGANSDYIGIDDVLVANVAVGPVCGNGAVEAGESCDDGNTANGDCCSSTCAFEAATTVCRAATGACDVAEMCTGISATCPMDNKAPNGTVCNDGNLCTQADTCQAGACTGANPVTCTASDQCHDVGMCNPGTGVCSNPAKPNGSSCNDGNLCTQADTCQAGACTGANPVTCTASDQCHDAGMCNPGTGNCSNPAKPNGTTCNDGNLCTQADTCQAGACMGANPITCTASDQCHTVGVCNPVTGVCSNPDKPNGSSCNDGNLCTQTDACQAGACMGANPVMCTASDQCHNVGTCNSATGTCSNPSKPDGTVCNDSNACTLTDTCQAGACSGANPVVCTASDQCHNPGTCNMATGTCSNPAKSDGSVCNDANACTQVDSCQGGMCAGASPVICTASDQCHDVGTCDTMTGLCGNPNKMDGSSCNDGDACTQLDTCQAGACAGAMPVTCAASNECHDVGTCDVSTGMCSDPAKMDGTSCSNGGTCKAGTCVPPGCGNGILDMGEDCDDSNMVDGDGCDMNCTKTGCGNGIVTALEECDDGNQTDGDGCASDCTTEGTGGAGGGSGGAAGAGGAVGAGGEAGAGGGGGEPTPQDGSCSCNVPGGDEGTNSFSWALFGFLSVLAAKLRRRRA